MAILLTADWQCHIGNLVECERVAARIETLLQSKEYTALVHLGDVKEHFNPIDQRVSNFLSQAFMRFSTLVPVCVVAGNHDRTSLSDSSPSCLPMLQAAGAVVFDRNGTWQNGKYRFDITPYYRSVENWQEVLKSFPTRRDTRFLLFHGEINGAAINASRFSTAGLDPELLKDYQLALGGHLHKPHSINPNIRYVGSPFPQDWGEANQEKSFTVLNGSVFHTIPTEMPVWYAPELPGFVPPRNWKGAKVRIKLYGDESEVNLQKTKAEKEYAGAEITFVRERPDREILEIHTGKKNSTELLSRYVQESSLPNGTTRKQALAFLQYKLGETTTQFPAIELESVEAKNVLSFTNTVALSFKPGVTLVTGENRTWRGRSNASGKTNLLSLAMVALYGQTPKGQTHDRWIGRSRAMGRVVLRMRANGYPLVVERTRRPSALAVTFSGEPVLGDANETQRVLNSITRLTSSAFCNSIYVGQREIATILTGTDKERKELLSRFLNLDVYLKTSELVRKQLSRVNNELARIENDISVIEARVEELDQQVQTMGKTRSISVLEDKKALITKKLDEEKSRGRNYIEEQNRMRVEMRTAQMEWDESVRELTRCQIRVEALAADLKTERSGVCSKCGQTLPTNQPRKSVSREEIKAAEKVLADCTEAQRQLKLSLQAQSTRLEKVSRQLRDSQDLQNEYAEQLRSIRSEMELAGRTDDLNRKIKKYEFSKRVHVRAVKYYVELMDFYKYSAEALGRNGIPLMLCREACTNLNAAANRYAQLFGDGAIGVRFEVSADGDLDVHIDNPSGGAAIDDQSMGEGRTAALIATFALRTLFQSNVIILDEPGEGLDSVGANRLGKALNQLKSEVHCIFVVTHNPYIVAGLEPDHTLCVVKDESGSHLVDGIADNGDLE